MVNKCFDNKIRKKSTKSTINLSNISLTIKRDSDFGYFENSPINLKAIENKFITNLFKIDEKSRDVIDKNNDISAYKRAIYNYIIKKYFKHTLSNIYFTTIPSQKMLVKSVSNINKKTLFLEINNVIFKLIKSTPNPNFNYTNESNIRKFYHLIFKKDYKKFLAKLSKRYELIVYSSLSKCLLNEIIKIIEQDNKYFSFIISKESCYQPYNIKSLTSINRQKGASLLLCTNIRNLYYNSNCFISCKYNKIVLKELYLIVKNILESNNIKNKLLHFYKLDKLSSCKSTEEYLNLFNI